jgi:hypothetical protein
MPAGSEVTVPSPSPVFITLSRPAALEGAEKKAPAISSKSKDRDSLILGVLASISHLLFFK